MEKEMARSLLEKEMATHSSTLTWKIPWTEEPGRLQSMGSQRVVHDWANGIIWIISVSINPKLLIYLSFPLSLPPSVISLFSVSLSLYFCFVNKCICIILLDCTYTWYHICLFCLTLLNMIISRSIHVSSNGIT